jgi:hypothetical protein
MKKLIYNFWHGEVSLWKSFWLIGLLHGLIILYFLPILETNFFNNKDIYSLIIINNIRFYVLDYTKVTIISKFLIIFTTTFVTVGIWRSAEKYRGSFIIIFLTLLYLAINNLFALVFYFKKLFV